MRLPVPVPADLSALVTREVLVDGQTIVYTEAGEGPPLLLLHGAIFVGNSFWWETQQALAGDFRTMAPDMPGWGESAKPAGDYGIERYTRFVGAFLDALGLDRVAIAGHSLGGLVGSAFGLLEPGRVSTLALLGVIPCWANFRVPRVFEPLGWAFLGEWMLDRAARLGPDTRLGVRRSIEAQFLRPAALPRERFRAILADCCRVLEDPAARRAVVATVFWAAVHYDRATSERFRLLARRSQLPILLIAGRHDPMFPLAQIEEAVVECPTARLVVLDACAHFPQWEQPERVVALLKGFSPAGANPLAV